MKRLFRCFVFALLIVSFAAGSSFAAMAEYGEGEVIVVMKAPKGAYSTMSASAYAMVVEAQAASFAQKKSLNAVCSYAALSHGSGSSISFFKDVNKTTAQLIEELKDDPDVLAVSPNYKRTFDGVPKEAFALPNDSMLSKQWGLNRINTFEVWDNYNARQGQEVYVAVIDTGVDYNHEDLSNNIARDASGKVMGRSFYGNGSYTNNNPMDSKGHGTHVAGIIGAVGNNRKGISGVHYRNIKIIPVNVFTGDGPRDGAWDADTIRGIDYILDLKYSGVNIKVVNMSLGGWSAPEKKSGLELAIQELSDAGMIISIAAGNDGKDISAAENNYPFPASFWMIPNKITVGSVTPVSYDRSEISNYDSGNLNDYKTDPSKSFVDMAAPGQYILSTYPGNKYAYFDGTSMAAPFVAGAAALLFSCFPEMSAEEIKECILDNTFLGVGTGQYWARGSLNVGKAYLQFDSNPATPINPNPTLEEQYPIVLEITLHGNTIVGKIVQVSVYPDTPGVWSTRPSELAHVEENNMGEYFLLAKSIGKVELIYTSAFGRGVISGRKEMTVLDIYHKGSSGCSANAIPLIAIPFVFFVYIASKRMKK